MHFGRDAALAAGAAGIAEHEHKKHHRRRGLVETRNTKPTLMTRLRGPNARTQTVKTTTTLEPDNGRGGVAGVTGGTAPVTTTRRRNGTTRWGRHRDTRAGAGVGTNGVGLGTGAAANTTGGMRRTRRPGLGDKISGAMMKLKGSLTNRPGEKAAGDRRMHGIRSRTVY